MFIRKESVNETLSKSKEKFDQLGIYTKEAKAALRRFENELSELADKRTYKEGEAPKPDDLSKITNEVALALSAVCPEMGKKANLTDNLMTVTDYLYAMTQEKLGCPDIPLSFGDVTRKHVRKLAIETKSKRDLTYDSYFVESTYNKQRRKDADEVLGEIGDMLDAVRNKTATPRQVQNLAAACQALKKRQDGHGAFWRLFHSKENDDRNALIQDMESAIKGMVGENVDVMKKTPVSLAEGLIAKGVENEVEAAFATDAMSKRVGISNEAFIHPAEKGNGGLSTEELRNSIANDLAVDDNKQIEEPKTEKKEVPVIENIPK